ncbi:endonuclease/exonuclease/phosphatase family protein [Pseudomonas sp. SB113]|uniref:endonuclease/exonuclease/phosphatase family protein n=1 Tax=Pseudomonas sp. SB113 TaxID=3154123 RepID=UPI00345DCFEE
MEQANNSAATAPRITVAWWNSSLAPRGISRESSPLREAAAVVVVHLVVEKKVDFIALGEMSESDLAYMRESLSMPGWVWESGICSVGKAVYDICYAYNSAVFVFAGLEEITDTSAGRTLRVAQQVNLVELYSGTAIVVLASHWPSRRNLSEHHPCRDLLGVRLRDAARAVKLSDNSKPHLILLGDYNDEPFSASLSEQLMASRDKNHVRKVGHLFYNPFWSYLGERADNESAPLGSYYWKQGAITRWLTLDQIIFSSNFISGENWLLCEKGSRLVDIPELTNLVKGSGSEFDHVPVYATIEKVE